MATDESPSSPGYGAGACAGTNPTAGGSGYVSPEKSAAAGGDFIANITSDDAVNPLDRVRIGQHWTG